MSMVRIAAVSDVEPGTAIVVDRTVTGTDDDIALFHTDDDAWYATDDTCTHEEASLAEGWLEGDEVECPLHAASFCLRTGAALCLPATKPVRTHRVEVRGDDVFLDPSAPAGS